MSKILITGGSGFLGNELAEKLKENNDVLLGSRNNKQNFLTEKKTGCDSIPMDVANLNSVNDVINYWKGFNECSYTTVYEEADNDSDGFYFIIYSHEGCLNNVQVYDFTAGGMYHSWPIDGQTTDDMPDGSTYIITFLERFDINGLRGSAATDYYE